jgi:hypothetical protein
VIAQVLADQLAELETDEHRVWVNLKGKDGKMFSAAAHRVQRVADGQGLTDGAALEAGADPAEIFGWVRSELLRVGTDPDQFDSEPPRQEESLL